jgi:hypothetical protein
LSREIAAPGPVRAAGALVFAQGVAALVVAVIALVRGIAGGAPGIFAVIALAFGAPGLLLWQGRRGARNGAVFLQLLVLGGVWYQFNPAESLPVDLLFTAYCLAVLVLLFRASSRAWAMGVTEEESQPR